MKKKQLVALIVAVLLFVVTCAASMGMNMLQNKSEAKKANAELLSMIGEYTSSLPTSGKYIARLDVVGEIAETSTNYFGVTQGYNQDFLMTYLDELMEDNNNVGLLMYVDSPGGSVYLADELYLKLMDYKELNRPIYCYFASQACSGGYYVAMAADEIYANRNCWTGSIGVIVGLTDMADLYEKLGIKEVNITSGVNKDMGTGGKHMTEEQKNILQGMVDEAYEQFVGIVCDGRNMSESDVKKIADGRIITATQALNAGLIDGISRYEEYEAQVLNNFGSDVTVYVPDASADFMSSLFGSIEKLVPKSETELLLDLAENKESGVIKYESAY